MDTIRRRPALIFASLSIEDMTEHRIPERLKRTARPFTQFLDGFVYFFRGFVFLWRHRKLWPYAILPFLINLLIVVVAAGVILYFLPDISGWIWKAPDSWVLWFLYIPFLALLFLFVPLLLYILFFMILPGIVAPPFKGKLTRYTREIIKKEPVKPVSGFYVDVIEPTIIELRKAVRLLAISVILLPLNLIPVLGQVAYVGLMSYFTWMLMAMNYLEYPIDSESTHTPLARKRRYIRSRKWPALGFGFAVSLTHMIPFVNFFCMPAGVVGATLLYQAYGEMRDLTGPESAALKIPS